MERARLHITDLWAGTGCPQVAVAQMIVVVVMVMVVDEVVHRGPLPASVLPGVPVGARLACGAGEEAQPHTHYPVDLHKLLAAFPGNVNQVFEEFIIAAAWLRKASEGAGVGQVAYALLLHQLALTLLRLRELRCYHHQAEVDHEERAHLRDRSHQSPRHGHAHPIHPSHPHPNRRSRGQICQPNSCHPAGTIGWDCGEADTPPKPLPQGLPH